MIFVVLKDNWGKGVFLFGGSNPGFDAACPLISENGEKYLILYEMRYSSIYSSTKETIPMITKKVKNCREFVGPLREVYPELKWMLVYANYRDHSYSDMPEAFIELIPEEVCFIKRNALENIYGPTFSQRAMFFFEKSRPSTEDVVGDE